MSTHCHLGSSADDLETPKGIFEESESQAVVRHLSKTRLGALRKNCRLKIYRFHDTQSRLTLSSVQRTEAKRGHTSDGVTHMNTCFHGPGSSPGVSSPRGFWSFTATSRNRRPLQPQLARDWKVANAHVD
jgi:hypothetical protein